jgi:ABC-type multidrug transport system ATPase subunit
MTVWEALDLYSSFYQTPANGQRLLEDLGLGETRNTRYGKLSSGQKQRLSIALAAHDRRGAYCGLHVSTACRGHEGC